MTELQSKLFEMFSWFHDFCVKKGIKYYMLGGTLLGAVRHKGFIPWDDDIDVGLPRGDYDRLIELMSDPAENDRYVLEAPLRAKNNYYRYCKLYDTRTTLIENIRGHLKRGIFLDIFPLDGIGNTLEESKKNYKKIAKKNKFIIIKSLTLNKKRNIAKNAAVLMSRFVFVPTIRGAIKKVDEVCKKRDFSSCEYTMNAYGAWGEREIVKREYFGEPQLYEFEGMQAYGPQNADEYLKALYGDYMQLPPVEKRKSHHNFVVLDLNKSYLV